MIICKCILILLLLVNRDIYEQLGGAKTTILSSFCGILRCVSTSTTWVINIYVEKIIFYAHLLVNRLMLLLIYNDKCSSNYITIFFHIYLKRGRLYFFQGIDRPGVVRRLQMCQIFKIKVIDLEIFRGRRVSI